MTEQRHGIGAAAVVVDNLRVLQKKKKKSKKERKKKKAKNRWRIAISTYKKNQGINNYFYIKWINFAENIKH